jgi:hypothetical protein
MRIRGIEGEEQEKKECGRNSRKKSGEERNLIRVI